MKSLFTPKEKKHIPRRKVDKWGPEEVWRWLSNVGLQAYADVLKEKSINGAELLKLNQLDVYELATSKKDAARILSELAILHKRERTNVEMLGASCADQNGSADGSSTSGFKALEQTQQVNSNPSAFLEGLTARVETLGISGKGLEVAAQGSPLIGPIISSLWELSERTADAKAFRQCCTELGSYIRNILRVFDGEGRRLATLGGAPLRKLLELIQEATQLINSCCQPGWLSMMLTSEKMDSFVVVHNAILQLLKDERLDVLPNGSHLSFGNYCEESRTLKRILKQVGGGSIEGGLLAVKTNEQAMREVISVLHVDAKIIRRELEDNLSQETVAASIKSPKAVAAPSTFSKPDDKQDLQGAEFKTQYQLLFSQYDKSRRGALSAEEFRLVVADLGVLDAIPSEKQDEVAAQQFRQADTNKDGKISLDEFTAYYHSSGASHARLELRSTLGPSAERDLQKAFCSFASFGVRQHVEEMEGAKFAKLCRDSKLLSKSFSATDVDLFFAKVKTKGARRITFAQFVDALGLVAAKKGMSLAAVVSAVLAADGPSVTGTRADYVKFHDDKSTYTGVYKKGGPSTVEPSRELSSLLDRSPADVRGIKRSVLAQQGDSPLAAESPLGGGNGGANSGGSSFRKPPMIKTNLTPTHGSGSYANSPANGTFAAGMASPPSVSSGSGIHKAAGPPTPDSSAGREERIKAMWEPVADEELHAAFRAFASFGAGMNGTPKSATTPKALELDGARFAKLVRDSGLLDARLATTAVDLVFSKVKAKGQRKIDFAAFERSLPLLAEIKGATAEEVRRAIVLSGGPRRNSNITADFVRLHDDKSTFTGVYAKGGPSTVDKKITLATITNRDSTEKGMVMYSWETRHAA